MADHRLYHAGETTCEEGSISVQFLACLDRVLARADGGSEFLPHAAAAPKGRDRVARSGL